MDNILLPEMFHKGQGFANSVLLAKNDLCSSRGKGLDLAVRLQRLITMLTEYGGGKYLKFNAKHKRRPEARAGGRILNIQLIVQLLVLVEEAKTEVELTAQLESLLNAYGFEYYGVQLHPRPNQDRPNPDPGASIFAGRLPDGWQELYISRKYALVDPTVRMLGIVQRPFRWRDAIIMLRNDPHRQRMQRMMQEGTRHGLLDGYIFPIHGRHGLLGHMMAGGKPVELSPTEIALFDSAAKKVFWRFLEMRGEAAELEAVAKVDTQLTRREMEVIVLLADGLTSNEIAKTLDISSHTVDWYINGLQEKLKAKNRQHVVASAFRLGLVI